MQNAPELNSILLFFLTLSCMHDYVSFQMLAAEQDKPSEPEEKKDDEGIILTIKFSFLQLFHLPSLKYNLASV